MSRQTKFATEGLHLADAGLTREDMILKVKLERIHVICPRCLYYGTLWQFSKVLKRTTRKHRISMSRVLCPDCAIGFTKKTILKVADMSMEEFAEYFWGGVFIPFGVGDKVRWDTFMTRFKAHYSRDNKQIFWDIYWEYKNARLAGGDLQEDREAYEDYKKTIEKETREDYEDYKKAFKKQQQEGLTSE